MDISKLKADKSDVVILHPSTEEPVGFTFSLLPMSSPKVKSIIHQIRTKLLGKRKQRFTPAEEELNGIEIMVASVCGIKWAKGATWNGEVPKFSEKTVRDILEPDSSDWIRDQLSDHVGNTANFFTN